VTPLVEPLSLDEAYLDVTEELLEPSRSASTWRAASRSASASSSTSRLSAGVAPTSFSPKIASGWKKPDGLTVIAPERIESFLQKLPVDALWGVGPVTARKLRAAGH
jgi:DNA polymerase-4